MKNFFLKKMDAIRFLKTLPNDCLDLVVTDPPYESLEKHRSKGTTTRLKISNASSNPWFKVFPNSRFPDLFTEVYRVLRRDRHFYLFCDAATMFIAKPIAEDCGFRFWKPLVWDKVTIGMGYHYRCRFEFILFFEKGKRKLKSLSVPDILRAKKVRNGYPAEKPTELLRMVVRQSTKRGELVCDPFFGSGSTGVAAVKEGCNFIGSDVAQAAIKKTKSRLREVGAKEQKVV